MPPSTLNTLEEMEPPGSKRQKDVSDGAGGGAVRAGATSRNTWTRLSRCYVLLAVCELSGASNAA